MPWYVPQGGVMGEVVCISKGRRADGSGYVRLGSYEAKLLRALAAYQASYELLDSMGEKEQAADALRHLQDFARRYKRMMSVQRNSPLGTFEYI